MSSNAKSIVYENGILTKGTQSRIFVNTEFNEKSYDGGADLVEITFMRLWSKILSKKQKKQFHFARDFFGKTYTMYVMKLGKEIFEEMCHAVVFRDGQTFTWDAKNK